MWVALLNANHKVAYHGIGIKFLMPDRVLQKLQIRTLFNAVMEICLKAKSGGERFVQSVQAAENEFTIAGFDPTFN